MLKNLHDSDDQKMYLICKCSKFKPKKYELITFPHTFVQINSIMSDFKPKVFDVEEFAWSR